MKFLLKRVGDLTHMEAEGTPEEIAAFVVLHEHQEQTTALHIRGDLPADRVRKINDAVRYFVATPPQNGVGSAVFAR